MNKLRNFLSKLKSQHQDFKNAQDYFDAEWKEKKTFHGNMCACKHCEACRDWYENKYAGLATILLKS
jgi:hypothetical protein